MAKAVFIQNEQSQYQDVPGKWYHFPKRSYLSAVLRVVGDEVIFYEGRRGDRRGYYAFAEVERVVDDPYDATHAFALLVPGSYLTFPQGVPRARSDGRLWESQLAPTGGNNASAVRLIGDADFYAILQAGLAVMSDDPLDLPRDPKMFDLPPGTVPATAFEPLGHPPAPPDVIMARPRILVDRALRDRAFSLAVKRAYGGRCAVSGLSLRNGGGRPEVEAAHIRPVGERGPDATSNGLALSGTVHWMFDRGLISAEDDGTILVAHRAVPDDALRRLIRPEGRLVMPDRTSDRPHQAFLKWHRDHVFKG